MNISKKKLALFLVIAFFAGAMFFAIPEQKKPETRQVIKNEADWKKLKAIDDEAFLLAGEVILACSTGALAAGNSDLTTLEAEVIKIQDLTPRITAKHEERNVILQKLGY